MTKPANAGFFVPEFYDAKYMYLFDFAFICALINIYI